jgi:ABC-type multidrug transport system permease subunit
MQVLFGRSWGPLLPVVAVIGAVVLALGGIAAVVAAHARTPEQVQTLVAGVSFVFALAGGTFAPPGAAGPRSSLAALVPTTYALDGFAVLSTERAGLGAIGGVLAALVGFAVVGAAGAGLSRRRWGWR